MNYLQRAGLFNKDGLIDKKRAKTSINCYWSINYVCSKAMNKKLHFLLFKNRQEKWLCKQ